MAHIQKIDNGKYKAVVEVGDSYNRKRKSKTFELKKDAQEWISRLSVDKFDGLIPEPEEITFQEFTYRWLENHKKPKVASSTYVEYKRKVESHILPEFGRYKIQEIKPMDIEQYFAKKRAKGRKNGEGGLSESTLKKHYVIMNNIFDRAIKLKILKQNPMSAIEAPKPEKKKAEAMSRAEYNQLLDEAKDELLLFTFIITLLLTGLRRSEALGLEWEDIDLADGVIHVRKRYTKSEGGYIHEEKTKTDSSTRKIRIPDKLIQALKKYKKEQMQVRLQMGPDYNQGKDFVFCRPDGEQYTPKNYNKAFNKLLDKAGLTQKYNLHTLRHTFATLNLQNDIPAKIVQEMLGHSTISTTLDIYSHVDLEMQKEATDKLNNAVDIG